MERWFSIPRRAARHLASVFVVIVVAAACGRSHAAAGGQAATSGERNADSQTRHVPLREGLMLVSAYRNTDGDFEAIDTVTHADGAGVTIAVSSDEPADTCRGRRRSSGLRLILREDLEEAHALRSEFAACSSEPERHPGSTAIGVSASVLRELTTQGHALLSATTTVAGMVPGVLTRIEPETVPIRVIVNDEPVDLKAVHVRWQSSVGAREYWILDDATNPLVLRGTYNGKPFLEVVKVSYPSDHTAAATRIEHDLAKEGRAIVYGIYFDFGSERIKEESITTLAEIARVFQQNPSWSLAVEGHTDNIGGDAYNLDLSRRRAAAVKQELVARYKIDGRRLQTNGYGASRAKETNDTLEGRARNRRVELVKVK
jgi:outer membrane protein OmpA-like peptidoglycan-associated protein